jgi:hypothetical protein
MPDWAARVDLHLPGPSGNGHLVNDGENFILPLVQRQGERVELGHSIGLRGLPFRLDPALLLKAVQRWV